MSGRVLITGGTGNTGRRIAARLSELSVASRTASRAAPSPEHGGAHVRFDWADTSTHEPALAGVDRVYLVAPAMVEDPAPLMLPFLERALASGAQRMVLLSSSAIPEGAPGLGTVERFLRERAPGWTILKPSWFMNNFVDARHPHGASLMGDGVVVTSTGSGRVGFVDAEDIAEVAVRALADETPHDTAHVITGPEALGYADVAAILARVTGRSMRHVPVDDVEARRRMETAGLPKRYAELLVGLDAAIREGAEDRVTDTVLRITGRAPRSFEAFARDHAQVFRRA
ncbi:Oxidoreductase [Minicystis rosea]|nr:Oxidoreductase [Minicystis rosea]